MNIIHIISHISGKKTKRKSVDNVKVGHVKAVATLK